MSELKDELRRWLQPPEFNTLDELLHWTRTTQPERLERLLRRVAGCAAVDHMGVRLSDFPEPESCPYCNRSILAALKDENDGD